MKRCVQCGGDKLVAATTETPERVGDVTFTVVVPATRCEKCGESYVSYDAGVRAELMVAATLPELGIDSGAALRYMRKALGLKAVELARLLGVVPETVSRWETGANAPIPRPVLATLAAMASDKIEGRTRTLDHLRALHEPRAIAPEALRLTVAG
jgi:putative zinc finger/helix-turn-helix YgiT family protein